MAEETDTGSGGEFWYPLDNAAKIYPAITDNEVTSVFRISAYLKEPVNAGCLFRAVHTIEDRFPYYKVRLKKGFFWYYFESAKFRTNVMVDHQTPCRPFRLTGRLFRVLATDNKLSVEFSHMLTDGSGAFEYFKTLLAAYFEQKGIVVPDEFVRLRPEDKPDPEEFEDAYNRYFKEDVPATLRRPPAFHLPFKLRRKPRLDVLYASLPVEALKQKAREKGVNITVYLISVYFHVLQDIQRNSGLAGRYQRHRKLGMEIPVNLRNLYESKTMRNFTLFVMPEIDLRLGRYTFDEILKTVYHQMQLETDVKLINKILALNVGSERKLLIRAIPLFIKSFVMKKTANAMGSSQYSGVLTNLGNQEFPPALADQIDFMALTPPPPNKQIKISCGVLSFNNKLVLGFSNMTRSKELERRFVRFLVQEGIDVKIIY